MKTKNILKRLLLPGLVGGALSVAAMPAAAVTDFYLIAKSVTITLPGGGTVDLWGYADDVGGACFNTVDNVNPGTVNDAADRAARTAAAACTGPIATVPGPKLDVPIGDQNVRVRLVNLLTERTSVVIPGQEMPFSSATNNGPTWNNGALGGRPNATATVRSFGREAVQNGGRLSYVWNNFRSTNFKPGTFLYHSGTEVRRQVQMGMYGGISQDYPGLGATKAQDIFLSAVDDIMAATITGGSYTSPLNHKPRYFMVNGEFVDVNDAGFVCLDGTLATPLTASVGDIIQLRLYNASYRDYAPQMIGDHFDRVAEGGNLLPFPEELNTAIVPAMATQDLLWTPDYEGRYWIQDRRLNLSQNMLAEGGLSACIDVVGAGGADVTGPVTSNVSVVPDPTNGAIIVTITASANDTTTGGSDIASGAYEILDAGNVVVGSGAMAAQDGTFDAPIEIFEAFPAVAALPVGTYTVSVVSTDLLGNTGAAAITTFVVSSVGVDNPPAANAGGPYSGRVGFAITLDGSASTDDNAIVLYEWDVDNDGTFDISTPNPTVSHTYTAAHTSLVALRVTDNATPTAQTNTAAASATITFNLVPIANPNGPYNLTSLTGTLDGSGSSDGDTDPLTYAWNFGDGMTGTGISPSHTWPVDGTYTVTLTVNDGFDDSLPVTTTVSIITGAGTPDVLNCNKTVYKAEKDELIVEVTTDTLGVAPNFRTMTAEIDDDGNGTFDRTLGDVPIKDAAGGKYKANFKPMPNPDPTAASVVKVTSDLGGSCVRNVNID